jgi:hypothetical protein
MKPARRMAPNFILMGLLACESNKLIGPRGLILMNQRSTRDLSRFPVDLLKR